MAARYIQDVLLGGSVALVVGAASAAGSLDALERLGYDQHFRRPAMPASLPVAVVAIDDASRAAGGPWPWPEARQIRLLEQLSAARLVVWPAESGLGPTPGFAAALQRHGRVLISSDEPEAAAGWQAHARGVAANRLMPDVDMVLRSIPLDGRLPPVSVAVLGQLGVNRTWRARQWLNYRGPEDSLPTYSAADVLAGKSVVRDRVVFVGARRDRPYARLMTPVGPLTPVTLQAQATLSALEGRDLRPPPKGAAPLGVILTALFGAFLWRALPLGRSLLAITGASLSLQLADTAVFHWGNRWLPWPTWLLGLWAGYVAFAVAQQVSANRQLAMVMDQLLTSYRERKSRHAFTTGPLQRMRPRPLPEDRDGKVELIAEIAQTFHQERGFFQMLLESHHQPVLVVDGEARVFVCNQAGQGLLGREVIGKSIFELLAPLLPRSTVDELRLSFHRAWLSSKPHQRFLSLQDHTFRLNMVPTNDVEGMLCLLEDVTALHERANTDALTGLWNRRFFDEQLETEMARSRRYKDYQVSLLLIDIDHFKRFNDDYGHLIGDRVLQTVANVVKSAVRTTDFAVRYGGEELAILLTHTDEGGAGFFAERLRQRVADTLLADEQGNRLRQITVSVGVAVMQGDADPAAFLARCDGALYASKHAGRNRVTLAPPPMAGPTGAAPAIEPNGTRLASERPDGGQTASPHRH